ncbi:unnamed protein product, partial [Closterium sp. NIES-53]
MTTLRVLLHVAAQRDYELHSLDFSTAFQQGNLHEEIWLRRPPGFTGSFPAGTRWSLWRPVYGLRQAPREWHDMLRTTLATLGFSPSTADPSLFLRTDATLPPFYVLVYVDDLVFATADTEALAHVKSELQKRHTCTDLDESVQPSGPYPELVGCLITSGMGLVLGGRARVILSGHADASWVDDLATQWSSQGYTFSLGSGSVSWRSTRSSSVLSYSCEAEIYAGAMAAQELRWLTYLLTDLGEAPCSPPVLYVDSKAMLALCQEHRLEHRTKHIALRYFLAQELQQRGQLRLAYVASQANTADVFIKALQPCAHQPCFVFLDWSYFSVWGCLVLVRNTSADKISGRALPCVFLGIPMDAPDFTFYHPPLHQFLDSRDVTFDESMSYYTRYPCRGLPVPPTPLPFFSPPLPPWSCPVRCVPRYPSPLGSTLGNTPIPHSHCSSRRHYRVRLQWTLQVLVLEARALDLLVLGVVVLRVLELEVLVLGGVGAEGAGTGGASLEFARIGGTQTGGASSGSAGDGGAGTGGASSWMLGLE